MPRKRQLAGEHRGLECEWQGIGRLDRRIDINVWIDPDHRTGQLQRADFGCAKQSLEERESRQMT